MENNGVSKNQATGERPSLGHLQTSEESLKNGFGNKLNETIVSRFERVVAEDPDRVASVCGRLSQTYGTLNAQANFLAEHLRGAGVRNNSFVAIYLDRSPEMLAAILGVLKAGGAYLPIDSTYPSTRVLEMLEDARPV